MIGPDRLVLAALLLLPDSFETENDFYVWVGKVTVLFIAWQWAIVKIKEHK